MPRPEMVNPLGTGASIVRYRGKIEEPTPMELVLEVRPVMSILARFHLFFQVFCNFRYEC